MKVHRLDEGNEWSLHFYLRATWDEWLASNTGYFILHEKASSTTWSEGKEHFVYAANWIIFKLAVTEWATLCYRAAMYTGI
jgi:hypothetical protein